jgi:hypothetical protein
MQKYKLKQFQQHSPPTVKMNCPHCGHFGVFEKIDVNDIYDGGIKNKYGQRRCPNPDCYGHVFIVLNEQNKLVASYPSETIPFNKEKIPGRILNAFEEAVDCFANKCFIAAAIMIRKTLEEICENKGAKGDNLKKRINDLGSKIIIPKELLAGLDDLRLLGNDAAHIEAKVFEEIGNEEISISIEFTIEILKAVYQYENLLNRLRGLKKEE